MGSAPSTPHRDGSNDPWWPIENQNLQLNPNESVIAMAEQRSDVQSNANRSDFVSSNDENVNCDEIENIVKTDIVVEVTNANETCEGVSVVAPTKDKENQSLEEFKEELRVKREKRQNAIAELRNEISTLRNQLAEEKAINKQLIDEKNCISRNDDDRRDGDIDEVDATSNQYNNHSLRIQLADVQLSLQNANGEILRLTSELAATKKQVTALKDVIAASKEMVEIREVQLQQLKAKLTQIESSLAEREMQVMSENLRQEYDRQLTNIRNLRALYEERARVSAAERENLNRQLETSRAELNSEIEKNKNLEEHIASLETDLKSTSADLYGTREQVTYYKAENKNLHDEMAVINQLFSQLLAGFNGCNNIDIDKLTHMLEENRDLLSDMTNRECSQEGAAQLPKILFDLVSQANENEVATVPETKIDEENSPSTSAAATADASSKVTSAQEIINNLPKVWKVLIELLNHQKMTPVEFKENNASEDCYKSVQTPTGPQMVLSVSKTYIKLKDLILEKKFLQKETNKLKNFNSHLESRLEQQEKRLGAVSVELNKTWNLVGRMQRQHRQLHTHEQVLRYQLQQKRRMLSELKEELEYCRRKWALAKEKNKESQTQWDSLRLEFSKRKQLDASNSAESGYSDGPASEDDDENIDVAAASPTRRGNKEKFLLKVEQSGRKMPRIHSVSPIRCAKEIIENRRNSDTTVTQFATEMFQSTAPVLVQPIMHTAFEGENSVKIGVHFETDSSPTSSSALVKVTEPNVHGSKPSAAAVRKLIESKASTSKSKTCFEQRTSRAAPKAAGEKPEESLEAMFLRLSGQETETNNESTDDDEPEARNREDSDSGESDILIKDEEIRKLRAARIQRLEEQCKSLLTQVTRTSNRNDELNRQVDQIQRRFTPVRETTAHPLPTRAHTIDVAENHREPVASTSVVNTVKTDEECLTPAEREYTSRRAERLARMEAECKAFLNKVTTMANRAIEVDNHTEYLHGRHSGEATTSEAASSTTDEGVVQVNLSETSNEDRDGTQNADETITTTDNEPTEPDNVEQ